MRRPLGPDGAFPSADQDADKRTLDHRAAFLASSENAASHSQVGNYGLAVRTIIHGLDGMPGLERASVQEPDTMLPSIGGNIGAAAQRMNRRLIVECLNLTVSETKLR
jgi:hypothetical protein